MQWYFYLQNRLLGIINVRNECNCNCIYFLQILQAVYFSLCFINDIIGNNEINPKEKPLIRKIKDYMYATVAFPVAMVSGIK